MKKSVKDIDLTNKKIIMRVDFNVPLQEGKISDDTRIRAALPTIKYILEQNGTSLILMSHLGRPKGQVKPELSLKPVAIRLSELIGKEVKMLDDSVGEKVEKACSSMNTGDIILLENLRFHEEEDSKDEEMRSGFAKKLSELADVYVNDAFGTAHREHASTATIARHMDTAVSGLLIEKELEFLDDKIVKNPARPFVAIIGGAKVSSKIAVMENLLTKVDRMIVGGGMAYTFLKAKGLSIGNSLVEEDMIEIARNILQKAYESHIYIYLPIDHIVTKEFSENAESKHVARGNIDEGWMGMDIGPMTIEKFQGAIKDAKTIFWNGPVGVFEMDKFAKGTIEIAKTLTNLEGVVTVIGGGDSVSAVNKAGVADKISHISTGGGASLEFLEGKTLPGISVLNDK